MPKIWNKNPTVCHFNREGVRPLSLNFQRMKHELIGRYNMKFVSETKWNEVYESDEYIMIWNRLTKLIKIKPKDHE